MTLTKRNGSTFPGIPALFDDFFSRDLFNWNISNNASASATLPAVNIRETGSSFEIVMAAPGMSRDDFKVELEGNELTISSERQTESESKPAESYSLREFSYESFRRSFVLPKDVVESDEITARYEHGLLLLSIPKRKEAWQKPPRLIEIA